MRCIDYSLVRVLKGFYFAVSFSLLLLSAGCTRDSESSTIKVAGGRVGQFKGHDAINRILVARLFQGSSGDFGLSRYLSYQSSLPPLMGGYSEIGLTNDFRNGTPNALNMLLWQIAFAGLSEDLANACISPTLMSEGIGGNRFNDSFAGRLKALCSWPSPEVKNETNLLNLWWAVQGFDAPREEFVAWRDFFLNSESPFAQASSRETLIAMFKTMFLNPYFLLEQ
jgi:hypothetical protein